MTANKVNLIHPTDVEIRFDAGIIKGPIVSQRDNISDRLPRFLSSTFVFNVSVNINEYWESSLYASWEANEQAVSINR